MADFWNLFRVYLILAEKQQPKPLKWSYWNYIASFDTKDTPRKFESIFVQNFQCAHEADISVD